MDFGLRWGRRKTLRVVKVKDQSQSTVVKDDRISNLPDSLLCHILSFLTTKEAIVTSILSSRWKRLWTFLPKLNFDSIEFEGISSSAKEQIPNQQHRHHDQLNRFTFAHIVFRVLALRNRNNVNPLKHFRLYWRTDSSDPIHVETWLHTLLSHDLEELDLHIVFPQSFIFPSTLFNHLAVVVLKLKGNIVLDPPSSSALLCFSSLKILHLENVHYAKHNSFSRLLSCCPVLQNLSVEIYEWGYSSMKIIVPTLKRLRLCYSLTLPKHNEVEINAPALEYLYFSGNIGINVLLGNLSNLVEADVGVHLTNSEDYGNRIRDFIGALSNVKSLRWDSYSAECLCKATEFDLPMFHNLAFLYFHVGTCLWNVLPHLLHRAPNLAAIVFHKEREFFICDRKDSSIIERMIYEDVPKCISSHLKTFHFDGFNGLTYELEFVRHILKTARFIETMAVSSAHMNSEEKVRVLKELLMFPRESRTCQIAFL